MSFRTVGVATALCLGVGTTALVGAAPAGAGLRSPSARSTGSAAAPATPTPAAFALDQPGNGSAPQIAYDGLGDTFVAWTAPAAGGVDLCVLPLNATACRGGAPVLLTDPMFTGANAPTLGAVVVLPIGPIVVLGEPGTGGTVAWASPTGGSAFLTGDGDLQNGGALISPVSISSQLGQATALSSTDVGIVDNTENPVSSFSDSSLTAESPAIGETGNANPGGQYPGPASIVGPDLAASAYGSTPGTDIVVGVGANSNGNLQATPPGCANDAATGYAATVGTVDGTSAAAGTLNGNGLPAYHLLQCAADDPVLVSNGEAGLGLVEQEGSGVAGTGSTYTIDWHGFDTTNAILPDGTPEYGMFTAGVKLADVSSQAVGGVGDLDASEDQTDGVYVLWSDEKGVTLDYSWDGGQHWGPPALTPTPYGLGYVVTGITGGYAEVAYYANPKGGYQVFVQKLDYGELLPSSRTTVTTRQHGADFSGVDLTIPSGTKGESDRAILAGADIDDVTGGVTYGLYSKKGCPTSSLVFSSALPINGYTMPASAAVTKALPSGVYYWKVTYSGNRPNSVGVPRVDVGVMGLPNAAGASRCGAEVLTVAHKTTHHNH